MRHGGIRDGQGRARARARGAQRKAACPARERGGFFSVLLAVVERRRAAARRENRVVRSAALPRSAGPLIAARADQQSPVRRRRLWQRARVGDGAEDAGALSSSVEGAAQLACRRRARPSDARPRRETTPASPIRRSATRVAASGRAPSAIRACLGSGRPQRQQWQQQQLSLSRTKNAPWLSLVAGVAAQREKG